MDIDKQVFEIINKHLLEDDRPSEFLRELMKDPESSVYPLTMLDALKKAEQSPTHHPEGNVWNHTLLVVDCAAIKKEKSTNPQVFMWAALLHDIGKPGSTRIRNGKITSYDHDKLGAKMAKEFLNFFEVDNAFLEQVVALVRWHMQILFVVKELPFADIPAMKKQASVSDVALLGYCDRFGRLGVNKKEEEENIRIFLQKCLASKNS